jgi:hypothetical protein
MKNIDTIIKQIDAIYYYFRQSRCFFPYLSSDYIGNSSSPTFNITKGLSASINYHSPITKKYAELNNRIGHHLNQNFLIRLYAMLDYYNIVSDEQKIDSQLPGSDEVDILRRLRRLFSHTSGKYNPNNTDEKKLVNRIIDHFDLNILEPDDFPISIDTVITPIFIKTKEYIAAKLSK